MVFSRSYLIQPATVYRPSDFPGHGLLIYILTTDPSTLLADQPITAHRPTTYSCQTISLVIHWPYLAKFLLSIVVAGRADEAHPLYFSICFTTGSSSMSSQEYIRAA